MNQSPRQTSTLQNNQLSSVFQQRFVYATQFPQTQNNGRKETNYCGSRFPKKLFRTKDIEDFLCPICQGVLDEPMVTPCGHMFCNVCISEVIRTSSSNTGFMECFMCPLCRQEFIGGRHNLTTAPHVFKNMLGKLLMKCAGEICDEIFLLEDYSEHKKKCPAAHCVCPFQPCNFKGIRVVVEDHLKECEYRSVYCPTGCGLQIQLKDIPHHLLQQCKEGMTYCGQCKGLFAVQEREKHVCSKNLETKVKDLEKRLKTLEREIL